jgi:hypothetical protein
MGGIIDITGKSIATAKEKTLCTITFLYTMKGVVNAKHPKSETVFAWVDEGTTNKDCVSVFNPVGVNKGMCIISDIIVLPIPTVTHED